MLGTLTVLASATNENLTVLENVREALDYPDPKYNQALNRQITRSSRRIASYLGRPITLQTYEAILPSYGGRVLQLPRYPVRSVSCVFDGTDTDGGATELSSTEVRLDAERGWLERDEGWGWTRQLEMGSLVDFPVPDGEYRNWLVRWRAGYTLEGGVTSTAYGELSTGRTLDEAIENACIEDVRIWHLSRLREPNITSERVGEVSISYAGVEPSGMPPTVAAMLEPFRSVI